MPIPQVSTTLAKVIVTASPHPTSTDETQPRDLTDAYVEVWAPSYYPSNPWDKKPDPSRLNQP